MEWTTMKKIGVDIVEELVQVDLSFPYHKVHL